MNKSRRVIVTIAMASLLTFRVGAAGNLALVTTTEDLASLAREIGGDAVTVEVLARGYQDPHFVEPKPSFILKLLKADLLDSCGSRPRTGLAAAAHATES